MVAVAQQVEHRIVTPEVAGSRPVGHPNNLLKIKWLRLFWLAWGKARARAGRIVHIFGAVFLDKF